MDLKTNPAGQSQHMRHQESAVRNERFLEKCLKKIHAAPNAEDGLRSLLKYLGEALECERVYVFEAIDRQHICNTYEWCREGVSSGIEQLPYLSAKDILPWYEKLTRGENIIEPEVACLQNTSPLIFEILKAQQVHSIILSPLLSHGHLMGFLGTDNPPPENTEHISVLFDVLAYFVCSLINQRELQKLRETRSALQRPAPSAPLRSISKTILLVDGSQALLHLNERILRPEGYIIQSARSLRAAGKLLEIVQPDAIIMDIDLPDGSSLDFCRRLHRYSDVPVIFLTAHSDMQTVREAIAAGGCTVLTKPYQLEELLAAVSNALEPKNG